MSEGLSRRQRKLQERQVRQWANDLAWLMGDPRGRRIVANLLERCRYGQDVFIGNSQGNYLQGRQSLANELASEIKVHAGLLALFHAMEVEAASAIEKSKQELSLQDEDAE